MVARYWDVSGDMPAPSPSAPVGYLMPTIRYYNSLRYHAGGTGCGIKLYWIHDLFLGAGVEAYFGIRLALHYNQVQAGNTAVFDNQPGWYLGFGNVPAGSYALSGRTWKRANGWNASQGIVWSGQLRLESAV